MLCPGDDFAVPAAAWPLSLGDTGLVEPTQALYDGAEYCAQRPTGCANTAGTLALYIKAHPTEVLVAVAGSGIAQLNEYARKSGVYNMASWQAICL